MLPEGHWSFVLIFVSALGKDHGAAQAGGELVMRDVPKSVF